MALVSRSADRHADYLSSLAVAGVDAAAFTADAANPESLRHAVEATRARFGRIDVGHYGPASAKVVAGDITELDAPGAEAALRGVLPAVEVASLLLPELTDRGSGVQSFAGGLSSVVPSSPSRKPGPLGRFAANAESRRSRRHGVAPLHRTNRGGSGDQRAGRMIARGVVDRTGSPNFAATPSLYAT